MLGKAGRDRAEERGRRHRRAALAGKPGDQFTDMLEEVPKRNRFRLSRVGQSKPRQDGPEPGSSALIGVFGLLPVLMSLMLSAFSSRICSRPKPRG